MFFVPVYPNDLSVFLRYRQTTFMMLVHGAVVFRSATGEGNVAVKPYPNECHITYDEELPKFILRKCQYELHPV
jgi:hypothetical protein